MVKNEAKTLPRLLDSVKGFVDGVIAYDTGSTDDTINILQSVGADILRGEFEDFGKSRSKLMAFAKGKADWLLLMDADQILRKDVEKLELTRGFDAYLLEHTGALQYYVARLVNGDIPWCFIGVTHEYIERMDGVKGTATKLGGVRIGHLADGGSRSDKFERDLRLLRKSFAEDPKNGRTVFYLANTLRDSGEAEEAKQMFYLRASMGGWDEEVFVSMLEAAKISQDPLEFWEAWMTRPTRAEPLFYLEQLYSARNEGAYQHRVHQLRKDTKIPAEDLLFVERRCYVDPAQFWLTIPGWCDFIGFYEKMAHLLPAPSHDNPMGLSLFVEVGTFLGSSFACFDYYANKVLKRECEMIAVDTFRGTQTEPAEKAAADKFQNGFREEFESNMRKAGVKNYDVLALSSIEAAASMFDNSVDFCFLDGDHSSAAIKADVAAWLPKVRLGGYLGGHDYDRPEVCLAVTSLLDPRKITVDGRCWVYQKPLS